MDFSSIIDHPNSEEIISKIVTGVSAKDIAQSLKIKYPDKEQKHLQLSVKIIQDFIDKHGDLDNQIKLDVAAAKTGQAPSTKIPVSILQNKTYQERINQIAQAELEGKFKVDQMIKELIWVIRSRLEQMFDTIQQNPTNFRADYALIKYFETLSNAIEKYDKIVNKAPDQIVQHNINVQIADQHIIIFQEAIRETLAHMDPESALLFMEIFTEKLNALKAPKIPPPTNNSSEHEIKMLEQTILPILEK